MDNIKQKKIELLAPAGGMNQLVAAVENGADAVYIGGLKFNARMNAGNFSLKDIREAICYAHPRGVKIYVTLNILIKDEELQEALEYVADLYEIGVDAIIVQDIGLSWLIKKYIPNMPIHLSTQGTIYNRSGVKNALNLGFERIVLARELSIEEIKDTTDLCEIEVFVHGALCMCYSGQCQMSRAIGGRSGNRGECAQPCRLPYTDDTGKTSYILSPKDLCLIDHLGELIEANVASLKIEGRMKSPEYVATVVSIYRKYIDKYYEYGKYEVTKEDKEALMQIFNRGGFTEGYFYNNPKEKILSGRIPKHQGIYIGKVIKRIDSNLIEVKLNRELQLGDGIEIQGKELVGNIVTYLKKDKNGTCVIGDIKGNVKKESHIYRTSSKQLIEAAKNNFGNKRRTDIGMVFDASVNKIPKLTIYNEDYEVNIYGEKVCEKAINRPLTRDIVTKQMKKTGDTPFSLKYITVNLDDECIMSASDLNKLRRDGLQTFEAEINKPREHVTVPKMESNTLKIDEVKLPDNIKIHNNVTKGNEDVYIKEHLYESPIVINNMGWIDELIKAGTKVYGGNGLNVFNWATKEYYNSIGVEIIEPAKECEINPEILMVTEHPINSKYIIDRKDVEYSIECSIYGDKYFIKNK